LPVQFLEGRIKNGSQRQSSAHDRKVRADMLERAKQEPTTEPGEKEYLDDLFERMKLWR
jgi:hypothetical protein